MATHNVVTPANLGPEFEIGTAVPNAITIDVDGTTVVRNPTTGQLSSPVTSLTYDPLATTLTYTDEQGNPTTIDLAGLAADIFVSGGSYDPATMVLTLTDGDAGTPDVTINLSSLLGVSVDNNQLLTNGTDGKPFLDCDAVKGCASDTICDAFGTPLTLTFPI